MNLLSSEFDNYTKGSLLVSTKLENYEKLWIDTISYFVEKNMSGVILSLNKSYTMLVKIFESNKINTKNITFIDTLTYNIEKTEGNCIYLSSPFNATHVAMVIDKLAQNPQNKFFIFDSLTTMLLSYDAVSTVKFFQFILPKLVAQDKLSILLAINADANEPNTNLVIKLCNKLVQV